MKYFIFFPCLLLFSSLFSQTQTIKGIVIDIDSRNPLAGATVYLADSTLGIGTMSLEDGSFRLENVPLGRQVVLAMLMGYKIYASSPVLVTSGKEIELEIGMTEEFISTNTVIIQGDKEAEKGKPVNEFSTVSTRSFSVEQVQRYPASLFDPSRVAATQPGVQQSRDYQNDIIVRGNSPQGLLWRLEGVDIANPNHFSRIGGSGGSISVFSMSLMGQSDFSTGAFAPEYGNATSGVFDVRFRTGNKDKREFTGRAGLIGVDFATEGPIQKGKSSYLMNFRYSTLALLSRMGIRLTADNTFSNFQDFSFNLNFKTSQNGTLTFFGVGGNSRIYHLANSDTSKRYDYQDFYVTDYRTQTGATGLTYTHLLDEKSYIRAVAVVTANQIYSTEDSADTRNVLKPSSREKYVTGRYTGNITYNRKISARTALKAGVFYSDLFYKGQQVLINRFTQNLDTLQKGQARAGLAQGYVQMRYRWTEKLTLTGGLHGLYLFSNQTYSVEPRLSLTYNYNQNHSFALAYGMHSQIQPIGSYYITSKNSLGQLIQPNTQLKPTKAQHFVLSYNFNFLQAFRIRTELYYQTLYKLPVSVSIDSTYMLYNERYGYGRGALTNAGTGQNYGIDMTIERFFSNRMFFLISGSVFKSTYKPLNGIAYSTRYDSRFSTSYMLGKEFLFKNGRAIEAGFRIVYSGGLRYTPADLALTREYKTFMADASKVNTESFPNYFRIDTRTAYRWSRPKYSASLSLDIQNITNRKNPIEQFWDNRNEKFVFQYGSLFVPVLTFMIDF